MPRKPTSASPQNRAKTGDRCRDGRFGPGNNANPGGRPKVLKELKLSIQLRGAELVDKLLAIAFSVPTRKGRRIVGPSHRERILAIKLLMEYGYGRPLQAVEISGPGGGPVKSDDIDKLTSGERARRLVELMIQAGATVKTPSPNGTAGGARAVPSGGSEDPRSPDAQSEGQPCNGTSEMIR